MKRQHILLPAIVISLFLLQPTFAAPPRYEITDLGTLPGWYVSVAGSINDRGDIVGSVYAGAWCRATLFDASGRGNNIDLGTLGGNLSLGPSINNNGEIVGYAKNASAFWRATLFDPSGLGIDNLDLGTLGGTHSFAHSINDNGQIVGSAENSSGYERATLFDPTGHRNNIELGTLGGLESKAHSINDSGQIVGWAEIRPLSVVSHATLFDPTGSGANIDLGTLGGNQSLAFSINVSGQIVGKSRNSSGYERATLFDSSGAGDNVDLGTLGGDWSSAEWINDNGQIVGAAAITSGYMRTTLFDSTGHGNNIDLNTLIDPNCGWTLEWGSSINNNGWIVGGGINPDGEHRAFLMTPVPPTIYYVDADATGANDGSSWADAFNYLQDALTAAYSDDEIWVAQGTYTPDSYSTDPNGSGDREATFQLINGVTVKGGYAGEGTPDPNARDIELYETILSGDLNGNDVEVANPADLLDEPTRAENSYHVVSAIGTDATALLDGFIITGANADHPITRPDDHRSNGGGMYNCNSSPKLTNCAFTGNSATGGGGGMFNRNSNPTLTNCIFTRNSAAYGGGIYNGVDSNEALTNCTFIGNSADEAGGGMCHSNANITIMTNCRFIGNSTNSNNTRSHAGGLHAHEGSVTLTNCVFIGNWVGSKGGGISTDQSDLTLINCTFSGNSALDRGGPMYCEESSSLTLTNCIVWANSPVQITLRDSKASISYSDIQGSWPGEGNIDEDPCFANPGYWDPNGVWIEGDYHLLPDSPCIDAGDPNYIAGPNETDLDGKPRVIGGRIDMGAYEYSPPITAEVRIVPRTINLASEGKYITCYIWLPEECDVADIDPNSVLLEGEIKPAEFSVDQQKQVAVLRFSREDVQPILEVGDIDLTIIGRLTDGTVFEGTDVIRVIEKAGKN